VRHPFLMLTGARSGRALQRAGFLLVAAAGIAGAAALVDASASDTLRMATADGRGVVLLPVADSTGRVQSASGAVYARTYETADHRMHEVTFKGQAYRAATPLTGPSSRILFDPSQRKFRMLLPSIRVSCASRDQADEFARLTRAERLRFFERLGFAILFLPDAVHPAEAAEKVNAASGRETASLRIRRQPPQWK